jgi:hypothetical protein
MAIIYTTCPENIPKCQLNVPTFSIPTPSKSGLFGMKIYHLAILLPTGSNSEGPEINFFAERLFLMSVEAYI